VIMLAPSANHVRLMCCIPPGISFPLAGDAGSGDSPG
jgi:hypothetical protein